MNQPPPLPKRLAWFAPGTWRRLRPVAIVGVSIAAYVLSPMPVFYIAARHQITHTHTFRDVYGSIYWPVFAAYRKSPALAAFYESQARALNHAFGGAMPER
jgi:hypothetical protein